MAKTKLHVTEEHLGDAVSEQYKKFFVKFTDIETLDVAEWRPAHLLGYICKKYEEHYNVKYSFRFNDPAPSKSYEVYQIKKLSNMLSSDPKILKEYIDWVFKYKIIEKKKRITALGYFTHVDIVNEYKFKFLLNKKNQTITRNDSLPANVAAVCSRHGVEIKTYAELAFLKRMPNQEQLFNALRSIDFRVEMLDKIA